MTASRNLDRIPNLFSDVGKKTKRTGYAYPGCRHTAVLRHMRKKIRDLAMPILGVDRVFWKEIASFGCHTLETIWESSIYSNYELPSTLLIIYRV